MEHQWIISGEGNIEPHLEVALEGRVGVLAHQLIIRYRRHRYPYLVHVVEVLKDGRLFQLQPMVYAFCHKECAHQMISITSLTTMGSEVESI